METFDVFSGSYEQDPLWLETAQNLNDALESMKARARTKPGPYFVYCCRTHEVIDSIDTSGFTVAEASHTAGGGGVTA